MIIKNSSFKKNLFLFLFIFLGLVWWIFWPSKPIDIQVLKKVKIQDDQFFVYTINKKNQEIKVDTKTNYDNWLNEKKNEKYFFRLLPKKEPIFKDVAGNEEELPFCFVNEKFKDFKEPALMQKKVEIIKNLLTVPAGTNIKYIEDKKYKEKLEPYLKFITENPKSTLSLKDIKFYVEEEVKSKEDLRQTSSEQPLKLSVKLYSKNKKIPLFVTNFTSPIQWPTHLEWSFFGYLWNVLIISISSFLYIFSIFFISSPGVFLGNLGLGIILTTILIRTLTWPIYTKTSTFSMNMNLIQPEIEKVKQKYALQKDQASAQKMQLEILKVYRKNNFSFWGFLISFLQLPLFIAINQTLTRVIVGGGIFPADDLIKEKFLGFISLNPEIPNNIIVIVLLSFLVGITMFILNKISLKKPNYLKTTTHHLTQEQKAKAKQSEKTMKIMSWIMIAMMVLFSHSNTILSLYWIVGNTYTIFQTLITRKQMEQKYLLLKNKSI